MKAFPRTKVENIPLPRMLMGSNWVLGYSHTSPSADDMIRRRYSKSEAVRELVEAYLTYDIDAMMAPFVGNQVLMDGIHKAEDQTGKKVTLIDTPCIDVSDSADGRRAAMEVFKAYPSRKKASVGYHKGGQSVSR